MRAECLLRFDANGCGTLFVDLAQAWPRDACRIGNTASSRFKKPAKNDQSKQARLPISGRALRPIDHGTMAMPTNASGA
jgi:hypothetical protein